MTVQQLLIAVASHQDLIKLGFRGAVRAVENQLILSSMERNKNDVHATGKELQLSREMVNYHLGKIKKPRLRWIRKNRKPVSGQMMLFKREPKRKPAEKVTIQQLIEASERLAALKRKLR